MNEHLTMNNYTKRFHFMPSQTFRKYFYSFVWLIVFFSMFHCRGKSGWQIRPFAKYEHNPILEPIGNTWQAKDVFNPAAWTNSDTVWMLYRAEDSTGIGQWNGTSSIGLAYSTDGLRFQRES